jgi:hypothetical protein
MFIQKGVIKMSSISWTSSSLSSYFSTSLNSDSTLSNFYSNLSDASLIKSGAYKKLMRTYVNQLKSSSSSTSSSSSSSSSSSTTSTSSSSTSSIKNTVLDELLEHKTYTSKTSNPFLDELLKSNEEESTVASTEDGTVVDKTTEADASDSASITASTGHVSDAGAGAIIDVAV